MPKGTIGIVPYLIPIAIFIGFALEAILKRIYKKENINEYPKFIQTVYYIIIATIIYSVLATFTGYATATFLPKLSHVSDDVHVIYNNNINATVIYESFDYKYVGGDKSKVNKSTLLTGVKRQPNELTILKDHESITKEIDEDEIIGDKDGIVTKIEYGTRTRTYSPLGLPVLSVKKSFVKVHLQPKNPEAKKAIKNLLNDTN
nr:MAG TPA: hypothetical protein [Caudoviricetes sp.]